MGMKKGCTIFILSIVVGMGGVANAAENIDPNNDNSQFAYGENVDWLNFEPGGDGGVVAEVSDSGITGYVWAENFGWVSLSCLSTSNCGNVDYSG